MEHDDGASVRVFDRLFRDKVFVHKYNLEDADEKVFNLYQNLCEKQRLQNANKTSIPQSGLYSPLNAPYVCLGKPDLNLHEMELVKRAGGRLRKRRQETTQLNATTRARIGHSTWARKRIQAKKEQEAAIAAGEKMKGIPNYAILNNYEHPVSANENLREDTLQGQFPRPVLNSARHRLEKVRSGTVLRDAFDETSVWGGKVLHKTAVAGSGQGKDMSPTGTQDQDGAFAEVEGLTIMVDDMHLSPPPLSSPTLSTIRDLSGSYRRTSAGESLPSRVGSPHRPPSTPTQSSPASPTRKGSLPLPSPQRNSSSAAQSPTAANYGNARRGSPSRSSHGGLASGPAATMSAALSPAVISSFKATHGRCMARQGKSASPNVRKSLSYSHGSMRGSLSSEGVRPDEPGTPDPETPKDQDVSPFLQSRRPKTSLGHSTPVAVPDLGSFKHLSEGNRPRTPVAGSSPTVAAPSATEGGQTLDASLKSSKKIRSTMSLLVSMGNDRPTSMRDLMASAAALSKSSALSGEESRSGASDEEGESGMGDKEKEPCATPTTPAPDQPAEEGLKLRNMNLPKSGGSCFFEASRASGIQGISPRRLDLIHRGLVSAAPHISSLRPSHHKRPRAESVMSTGSSTETSKQNKKSHSYRLPASQIGQSTLLQIAQSKQRKQSIASVASGFPRPTPPPKHTRVEPLSRCESGILSSLSPCKLPGSLEELICADGTTINVVKDFPTGFFDTPIGDQKRQNELKDKKISELKTVTHTKKQIGRWRKEFLTLQDRRRLDLAELMDDRSKLKIHASEFYEDGHSLLMADWVFKEVDRRMKMCVNRPSCIWHTLKHHYLPQSTEACNPVAFYRNIVLTAESGLIENTPATYSLIAHLKRLIEAGVEVDDSFLYILVPMLSPDTCHCAASIFLLHLVRIEVGVDIAELDRLLKMLEHGQFERSKSSAIIRKAHRGLIDMDEM